MDGSLECSRRPIKWWRTSAAPPPSRRWSRDFRTAACTSFAEAAGGSRSILNREKSYLRGDAVILEDTPEEPAAPAMRERAMDLYRRFTDVAKLENPSFQERPNLSAAQLSYRIMAGIPAELNWKQTLLELRSERERLIRVMDYFQTLIQEIEKPTGRRRVI
jgi:Lon protease-like protein